MSGNNGDESNTFNDADDDVVDDVDVDVDDMSNDDDDDDDDDDGVDDAATTQDKGAEVDDNICESACNGKREWD